MSICITKNGNLYQKSNTGKVVASGVGAVLGGYLAFNNSCFIKQKINDVYVSVAKKAGKGFFQKLKDIFTGKKDLSALTNSSKFTKNICKYGFKFFNGIKKHPVFAGAVTGGLAFLGIGAIIDKNINKNRANEADKNQNKFA